MKTKINYEYKPYEQNEMPHRMFDNNGRIGAMLGGGITGLWSLFTGTSHLGGVYQVDISWAAAFAAGLFILKFVVGSVVGGALGKFGGNAYTRGNAYVKNYLRNRKIKRK